MSAAWFMLILISITWKLWCEGLENDYQNAVRQNNNAGRSFHFPASPLPISEVETAQPTLIDNVRGPASPLAGVMHTYVASDSIDI